MKKYGKILLGAIIWTVMMLGCVCTARADDAHSHEGWTKWTSANSLPGEAGKYYLNNDITLTSEWIVPTGETSLCLNGHKIELGSDITNDTRCVIRVYYGTVFNLFDCDQTVHKYSINENHIAVLDDNGSKSFTGGYITSTGDDKRGIILGDESNAVPNGYETFNMYGGTVFGNGNGGVTLDVRGTFNMHGGEIIGNKAMWGAGAAVYSLSSMTMSGGKIRDNYSYSDKYWGGGGVFLSDSFTMTGGEISNNTAVKGGGVFHISEEAFKMTGGTIIKNTATSVGGGVYLDGDLDISGNPRLKGNNAGNHADNVYCPDNRKINVTGDLTDGASIGVTMQTPGVFTSGYRQKMGSADPAKFFHSDSSEYHVELNGNEAALSEGHFHDGVTFQPWNEDDSLPADDGYYYYLTKDVTLRNTAIIHVLSRMNLCLNGHSITITGTSGAVIYLSLSSYLSLYDCDDTPHSYTINPENHSVAFDDIFNDSHLTFTGGCITGGKDGGVEVRHAYFSMYGGTIIGNSSSNHGSGVYLAENSEFYMYGGAVISNTTDAEGGGVYVSRSARLEMQGSPKVYNNLKRVNGSYTADNCYLGKEGTGCVINITDRLTDGARIGVTMENPGVFTSGYLASNGGTAPSAYFSSDNSNYAVTKSESGEAQMVHEHSITYTANGNTITAACAYSGCTLATNPSTLTINAPALTTYGGTESAEATITDADGIRGDAAVKYYKADENGNKDGNELGAPPASAGKYRAEITLGSGNNTATAYVVYEIKPISVTCDKASLGLITGGDVAALTAAVGPEGITDQTVIWSVSGTNTDAVTLYSDAGCENEVGTAATSILTVYVKGISAGTAVITAMSNADNTKTADCEVTVEAAVPTSITVNNMTGYKGFDTTIGVTVGTESGLYSGAMEVTFPDNTIGTVQINNNSGSVSWHVPSDFETRDYTVTVSYPAAANPTINGTGTLTVKEPITIDVGSVYYVGDNIVITLTVPSDAAEPVAVSVDGMNYVVSDDLKVTIAGSLPEGNHSVTASLKYNGVDVTATKDFAVQKYGTSITVSADDVYFGENVTVTATVTDSIQGKVVFYLDDSETGTEGVIDNMTATCIFSGLSAGSHTVKAVLDDMYYTAEPVTADFYVNKAPISPKVNILGWTYGDAANTPTVEDYPGDGSISYTYTGIDTAGTAYSSDQPPVNAGAYTVTATIPETDNYEGKTVDNSFTIATKGVPLVWGNTNLVYSGEPQMPTASVEGLVGSDTCSVNVSGAQTNANADGQKYTASLGDPQVDNPNYSINTDNGTVEFTISPKSIMSAKVTLDDDKLTYNASEQPVSVSAVKIGNLTVDTYDMSGDTKGTNVGTYTLTVTGTGNFKDSATAEWKIIEKDMTVSAPNVNVGYDGQPHGITVTVSDPASGADVKYGRTEGTYDLDASPTITDSGDLTVYYKVTAANYNVYTGSATVTITKKQATVTAANQTIKEGESIQTGIAYATLTGAVSGHTLGAVTLTAQNGEIIASAAEIKNGDDDVTENYNISYKPGSLMILGKVSAKVTFKVVNGAFNDGTTADKTVTLTGNEGDTLKLATAEIPAVGGKPNADCKAGSWDVSPVTNTVITADKTYTYTYAKNDQPVIDESAAKLDLNAGLKLTWKGSKITLSYGAVPGATEYDIYASYCGTTIKKLKSVKRTTTTIKALKGKKLNKRKIVKVYVVAKKGDTKLAKSITVHVAGPKNRYTNAKEIKLKKNSYKLKKGKSKKIKAKSILEDANKKMVPSSHCKKFRYVTSDKNVATVSKKGEIKARGKGTCTIYVYTVNGFTQKINVEVK